MPGSRAYHRWQRQRTINRKVGLLNRIGGDEYVFAWTHGMTGRLAKGKIHCSCPMCRSKSSDQISHRDAKKDAFAVSQLIDHLQEADNG